EQRMRDLHTAEPVQVSVDVMGEESERVVEVPPVHERAADVDADEHDESRSFGGRLLRERERELATSRRKERQGENCRVESMHARAPSAGRPWPGPALARP